MYKLPLLLTLVVIATVACGSGGKDDSSSKVMSQAALEASLLTLNDMPQGWTQSPSTNTSTPSDDPCAIDFTRPVQPAAQARASFTRSQLGPVIAQALLSFPEGRAQEAWDKTLAALQSCRSVTAQQAGEPTTLTITPTNPPLFADDTVGFHLSLPDNLTGRIESDVVYVLNGDVIIGLVTYWYTQERVDQATFVRLLEEANGRLNSNR